MLQYNNNKYWSNNFSALELTMSSSVSILIILIVVLVLGYFVWAKIVQSSSETTKSNEENENIIIDFPHIKHLMELDIERARRLSHKLSILVIHKINSPSKSINGNSCNDLDGADLKQNALILREKLRIIDTVAYDENNQSIIIMQPGVDDIRTSLSLLRIRELLKLEGNKTRSVDVEIPIGCAEYPCDGLSLEDLITKASIVGSENKFVSQKCTEEV